MDKTMVNTHNAHLLCLAERIINITEICENSWGDETSAASDHRDLDQVIAENADTPYQAVLIGALLKNGWNDAIRWALETKKGLN